MPHRIHPALALLVAVLVLPSFAGARMLVRLVPEVSAGGGWASELFPGADFGRHGHAAIAPALGVDLSTGPVVKLLSRYRYTLSRYLRVDGDAAGSQAHDLELTPRLRLGRGFDLDVPVAAGVLTLDETAPVEEDLPALEAVRWIEAGPILRYHPERESRVEAGMTLRASALRLDRDDGWTERAWAAFAGGSRRFGPRVEAALRYEHLAVDSAEGHDRGSDGIFAVVAVAPWGELVARASAGLEHVRYPAFPVAVDGVEPGSGGEPPEPGRAVREDLRRVLGVSASHPLGEHVDLEASVAWTETTSNLDFGGDRLSTWLGVRAQLPQWL